MFDIGQKVVCVDDKFPDWVKERFKDFPVEGKVYVVRDIIPGSNYGKGETCAVLLVGLTGDINKHGIENGFAVRRFVPLDEYKQKQAASKSKKKQLSK